MIDFTEGKVVDEVYRFVVYFDATNCIPNMGSDGNYNLLSDERYYITPACIKHKIRNYLQYIGRDVLHIDLKDQENKTIKERLIGKEKISKYTSEELFKMECEYEDIRMFGTMDVAGDMKVRGKVAAPITISMPMTLDKVNIIEGRGSRSYSVDTREDGSNKGSSYNNQYWFIEYGLFEMKGGINLSHVPHYGLLESDVDDLFEAIWHMFDIDSSTFRPDGSMNIRKMVVWRYKPDIQQKDNLSLLDTPIFTRGNKLVTGFGSYEYHEPSENENVKIYIR